MYIIIIIVTDPLKMLALFTGVPNELFEKKCCKHSSFKSCIVVFNLLLKVNNLLINNHVDYTR